MASTELLAQVIGFCLVNLTNRGRTYKNLRLSVLPGLCASVILGIDFQSQHENMVFNYGGPKPSLSVCGLSTLNINPPKPFANLLPDCRPIAAKSRRYSQDDRQFIDKEVERLLNEGIMEPSTSLSPWQA